MRIAALVLVTACRAHFDAVPTGDGAMSPDVPTDGAPLVSPRVVSMSNAGACAALDDGSLWCWGDNQSFTLANLAPGIIAPTRVTPALDWVDVATTLEHSCGRTRDGALWCWGQGTEGELGTGDMANSQVPVQVGTATDWTAIAVGYYLSCGLRGGALYCWGENSYGEVGDGTTTRRTSPVQVMPGTLFTAVATFSYHACAIANDGALYCWGLGAQGQLGVGGTPQNNPTPLRVGTSTWRTLATGDYMTCGVRGDGTLWCWGAYISSTPVQVGTDTDWTAVTCGDDDTPDTFHVCGLRGTGLWCAGGANRGQLGTGSDTADISLASPTQVDAGHAFAIVAAAESSMCAARDGVVACTGLGASGQLGDGLARIALTPRALAGTWATFDTGYFFTTAIASDMSLWAWGNDSDGEVPTVQWHGAKTPAKVGGPTPPWQHVDANNLGALAILGDGTLWRTGAQYSQPGVWNTYSSPFQIGTATWLAIDGGNWHDCGIQSDGSLWCWGANNIGELGNGTASSSTPVHIDNPATYKAVSAGMEASCGIRTNGTLYCWGGNVGDGTSGAQTSPKQVGTATWTSISVGTSRTCGLQSDSSLWCWGIATGDDTSNGSLVPEHIGIEAWTAVAAGATHTCAVHSNKSLWCWGSNASGQLGDGTRTDRLSPTRVGTGNDWTDVHVGFAFTCALTSAGVLSCWGTDHDGALGGGLAWTTTFQLVQGTSL